MKQATFKPCDTPGEIGHRQCAGHYDSYEECNVELWGWFGHYKCHAPQFSEGICQFHWDTGNTEALFTQNTEQIILHACKELGFTECDCCTPPRLIAPTDDRHLSWDGV